MTNAEALAQDQSERAEAEALASASLMTSVGGALVLDPDAVAQDEAAQADAAQVLAEADPAASSLFDLRTRR